MVDAYGRELHVGDRVAYICSGGIRVGNITKFYDNNDKRCSVDNHPHIYYMSIYLLNEYQNERIINEDTTVYSIEYCCGKNPNNKMGMCYKGFCKDCSNRAYYIKEGKAKDCSIYEINKSVFFSYEEAENKLKKMELKK